MDQEEAEEREDNGERKENVTDRKQAEKQKK